MENMEEVEIVKLGKRGDVNAYSLLVKKYSNAVFATAYSITNDFHTAQDIAQEALIKAWFSLENIQNENKFGNWVYTITKRLCIDWIRSKKHLESIDNYSNLSYDNSSVELMSVREDVWEAINVLDEPKRVVTILYYFSGFNTREISKYLNLSISAVESRLRRSKQILKQELITIMKSENIGTKVNQEIYDEVLWRIVPRIATIEIPVSNIKKSVEWYQSYLGTKVSFESPNSAMLHLQGGNRIGVPTLYLVETKTEEKLSFVNTNTNITHSVIDFYVQDLQRFHSFLKESGVEVTEINYIEGLPGKGGFGFKDPDGNSLSACNVTHQGQE